MKKVKYVLFCLVALALAQPGTARADTDSDIAAIGIVTLSAQLAPACGVRDAAWGDALLQGASIAVQAKLPSHDMFATRDQLNALETAQAMVGAGYWDGAELYRIYGKAACHALLIPDVLSNADAMVKVYNDSDKRQIADPSAPAGIPNAALQVAWALSRSDLALFCKVRGAKWGDDVAKAAMLPLSNTDGAAKDASQDDQDTAFGNAQAAYKLDQLVADAEFHDMRATACKAVRTSPALVQLNKYVAAQAANPDPWAGVGQ